MTYLQWYKSIMGANTSKIDDEIIALDDDNNNNNDRRSSPASITTSTPQHERLLPIESRETIRTQASQLRRWRQVDASDDLYESVPANQSPDSLTAAPTSPQNHDLFRSSTPRATQTASSARPATNTAASLKKTNFPVNNIADLAQAQTAPTALTARPTAKRGRSPSPQPKKKRRLTITAKAANIAAIESPAEDIDSTMTGTMEEKQTLLESKIDSTSSEADNKMGSIATDPSPITGDPPLVDLDQKGFPLYQDEDFNIQEPFDDEGYQSITAGLSDNSEQAANEQEEHLVKMLVSFRGDNISLSQPTASGGISTNSNLEEDQDAELEEARLWMLRDQEAGAERSRMLREQAIQRNAKRGQLLGSSGPDTTVTIEDEDSDASIVDLDNEPQRGSGLDGRMPPLATSGPDDRNTETISAHPEPDPEDLLDIVQHNAPQIAESNQPTLGESLKSHRLRKSPNALNPASRAAAEQFRTQSRHLDHAMQKPAPASHASLEEREQRLRALTRAIPSAKSSIGHNVSSPDLSNQFAEDDVGRPRRTESKESFTGEGKAHPQPQSTRLPIDSRSDRLANLDPPRPRPSGLDMLARKRGALIGPDEHWADGTKPHEERRNESLQYFAALNTTHTKRSIDSDSVTAEPLLMHSNSHNHNDVHVNTPDQSLPGQDILASRRGAISSITKDHQIPRTKLPTTKLSITNAGLSLPANFDKFSEEEQKVIFDHETAKERKRDLETIDRTTQSIGLLRCLGTFTDTDRNELDEVRKYITQVVDRGGCGKARRKRIVQIHENMRRRALNYDEPGPEEIEKWLLRLFNLEKLHFVRKELARLDEKVVELGDARRMMSVKRHNKGDRRHKKKHVRFSEAVEESGVDAVRTPRSTRPKYEGANATENRRLAQYARQDRLREEFTAKLKLFDEANEPPDAIELPEQHDKKAGSKAYHGDDEESEEDDGAEFVFGAGQSALPTPTAIPNTQNTHDVQDIREINRLEDARQKESGTHATQIPSAAAPASQGFDPKLLEQMQRKKIMAELGLSTSTQSSPAAVVDDESETDSSDDTDSDSESDDDDEEEDRQLFKYTVKAQFAGLDIYKDAEEYRFKSTYTPNSAIRHIGTLINSLLREFPPEGGINDGDWNLEVQCTDGRMEQHLMIGKDADVEALVWIDKEIVDVDKKAFRSAKRKKVVLQRALYTVVWEKIVTPIVDEVGTAATAANGDGDDAYSLFGDEPVTRPQPVVTTIPNNEIAHFTTSILANRHAKDVYMAWHYQFLPGVQNEGYRRLEDEAMEQDLERLGSFGLFSREESFQRVEKGGRVEERFKVYVRTVEVMGPRN